MSILTDGVLVGVLVVVHLARDHEGARDYEKSDRSQEAGVGVPRPRDARSQGYAHTCRTPQAVPDCVSHTLLDIQFIEAFSC